MAAGERSAGVVQGVTGALDVLIDDVGADDTDTVGCLADLMGRLADVGEGGCGIASVSTISEGGWLL